MLLTYNCRDFVADALGSVLGQDCQPMEVVVSDDASTDDTFTIVQREVEGYAGPHRVILRKRDSNSGSKSAHLNDVFPSTSGRILVSFDADDISETSRVRSLLAEFHRDPGVAAVYSGYGLMDETGRPRGSGRVPHPAPDSDSARHFARIDAFAAGATLAIRRDVVEVFGPLDPDINEDVLLPFRASLLGRVWYLDEDLVQVRRWAGSLTAAHDRFESLVRYRAWLLEGVERARRQFRSRLMDLATAEALMPERASRFDELRAVASDSLAAAEASRDLADPSRWRRTRCLLSLLRTGADPHELLQCAAIALIPGAYLRYKRWALAAGRSDGKAEDPVGSGNPAGPPAG